MKVRNYFIAVVLISLFSIIACQGVVVAPESSPIPQIPAPIPEITATPLPLPTPVPSAAQLPTYTPKPAPLPTSTPVPLPDLSPVPPAAPIAVSPTPTPTPPPAPTPSPTPVPIQDPFRTLSDVLAAYAGADATKSPTANVLHEEINGTTSQERLLPTVVPVLYSEDKNTIIEFGPEYPAFLLIDKYVMTSVLASKSIAPGLPGDLQKRNLIPGMALKFSAGPESDERPEFEILGESVGSSRYLVLEIFERVGDPVRPHPALLPFGTQDLGEESDPEIFASSNLVFIGKNRAGFSTYPTQKRASISSIDYERSILAINGTVTGGDYASPIFLSECGAKKLVGFIAGSYAGRGEEKEAFGVSAERVIDFFEEITEIEVQTQQYTVICPEADHDLTKRLIAALSDGLPDSSYDLAYLTNALQGMDNRWIRPFENFISSDVDNESKGPIDRSLAFLVDKYVGVLVSSMSVYPFSTTDKGERMPIEEHKYRILWGGKFDGDENNPVEYEYLKFKGYDETRSFAIFERPDDTKFPVPEGLPFLAGSSGLLEVKDVLYKIGTTDFGIFAPDTPYPILQSIDPAFVIGFSGERGELLDLESNLSKDDVGGAIYELIDGVPRVAGFFYAPLNDWGTETLGSALSIEFILGAIEEITCRDPSLSCLDLTDSLYTRKPVSKESQTILDRYQIISLLRKAGLDSLPLMTDLLKPDASALSRYGGRIVIFAVDETGALIGEATIIEGEVTFLSDEYALTTATLFPRFTTQSRKGFGQDAEYTTSNILFENDDGKHVEVRIGVIDKFSVSSEMFGLIRDVPLAVGVLEKISDPSFFNEMDPAEIDSFIVSLRTFFHRQGMSKLAVEIEQIRGNHEHIQKLLDGEKLSDEETFQKINEIQRVLARLTDFLERRDVNQFFDDIVGRMQILDVERIDWKQGYALLKRSTPPLKDQSDLMGLRIVRPEEIPTDTDILISYSQYVFRDVFTGDLLSRLKRVSPGIVVYASESSPVFIINGFATVENLGSGIFTRCGGEYCPVGIVSNTYPIYPDKIQTEGFGLSLEFILEKIKEDTGIDLREEVEGVDDNN